MEISSQRLVRTDLHLFEGTDEGFIFHDRKPGLPMAKTASLGAAESQKLIKLISLLRLAEQARCHMPRYAAECHYESGSSVRITFCFLCKNIIVSTPEIRGTIEFDPSDAPGNNLLTFLNSALGQTLNTKNA